MVKYVIGAISTILLLVLVFVFVVNRGDDQSSTNTPKVLKLVDYAEKDSHVTFQTDGRLVGEEERRSVRITVSANERRLEVLSGYNNDVINSQSFPNTQAAYAAFLSGLSGQGFMQSKKTSVTNPLSVCVNGKHYYYTVTDGNDKKSDLWSVSCDKTGTFGGRANATRELFQRQIPEYNQLTQGVKL